MTPYALRLLPSPLSKLALELSQLCWLLWTRNQIPRRRYPCHYLPREYYHLSPSALTTIALPHPVILLQPILDTVRASILPSVYNDVSCAYCDYRFGGSTLPHLLFVS